jgi:nitrate reductase gamma subunit
MGSSIRGESMTHVWGDEIGHLVKLLAYVVVGGISGLIVLAGCYELIVALLDPLTPFWAPAWSPYPKVEAYVYPVGVLKYTPSPGEVALAAGGAVGIICVGLYGCIFAIRRLLAVRARRWSP